MLVFISLSLYVYIYIYVSFKLFYHFDRGNLNLTLLPSSNLRISFIGDDCCTEKLSVLGSDSESSTVTIEDISADSSGRSFLMRFPGGRISYFWCSEKSRLLGAELLTKVFLNFTVSNFFELLLCTLVVVILLG